jgi:diguanylate cyclase (GGDEF)-like protein/PAS domain S-box-containing protein
MESCTAAILITDHSATIHYANERFYKLTGYDAQDVIGHNPSFLQSGQTAPQVYKSMWARLRAGKEWHGELINRKKDGTNFVEKSQIVPFRYEGNDYYIAVKQDITLEKNTTKKLSDLAYYDALTQLPNRTSFFEHLNGFLNQDNTEDPPYSLLLIDLNEFKSINDSRGHDFGDQFLKKVAEEFYELLSPFGIVARLGGDEFVALLPSCDLQHAQLLAQQVTKSISNIKVGHKFERASASTGISTNTSRAIPASVLLKQADLAMYKAKEAQLPWACYTEKMGEQWGRKKALGHRLSAAVDDGSIGVDFLPVVDLIKNEVIGHKSRLEWHDEIYGTVDRYEFIAIAEESQLIRRLNRFTIERACQFASSGQTKAVAVKISSKNFGHDQFVEEIKALLTHYSLPASSIVLEVFEEMLTKKRCVDELYQLAKMGCKITVADFGMGHISLSELRLLPIQKLKINESLTQEIELDPSAAQVVKAIVSLASVLNIDTIAEGVSSESQLRILREIGCLYASGPYIK